MKIQICLYCWNEIIDKNYHKRKYCNNICQWSHRSEKHYEYFLSNPPEFQKPTYECKWLKPIILKEQWNKCSICKCSPFHNNKPLIFIIDHIDGDAWNNTRDNLRLVCPNCDTQLDTYKAKNIWRCTRKFNVKVVR